MSSVIMRTTGRTLVALLTMFSFFLLLRGHDHPGGGFIGGLIAGSAFGLYAMAYGERSARQALTVDPLTLVATGLLIALASGMAGPLMGQPFLTGTWYDVDVGALGTVRFGTPVLFDIGVYVLVVGMTTALIFTLGEG